MKAFQIRYGRCRTAAEEYLQSLFLRNRPYARLQEAMRCRLLGLEGCGALVAEETRLAKETISGFPENKFLLELADRRK